MRAGPWSALTVVVFLIVIAVVFDFLNGLHDAANSIATIVSTRVLRPQFAVGWAAFFNFIAFLFFGLHVAQTVGTGIVTPTCRRPRDLRRADGAIVWNVVTWIAGISSSSHALIGGLVGAGAAKGGLRRDRLVGPGKTAAAIVGSPLLGFVLALLLVLIVSWLFVRTTPMAVDRYFRGLQFVSASLYSLGHGGNDAQKTMGIIAVLLFTHGQTGETFYVPFWVVIPARRRWGSDIVRRLAHRPHDGLAHHPPAAGAGFLRRDRRRDDAVFCDRARHPGVHHAYDHRRDHRRRRAARRVSAVRWNVAQSIVIAWIVTMPAAAIIAAPVHWTPRCCSSNG